VVRHATRYGLPATGEPPREAALAWLLSHGTQPPLDRELGLRRARAATLLTLALPGSAYLYQGEELGLHEVGDLPAEVLQDPEYYRSHGARRGRDGCRVPIPWTTHRPAFGFSEGKPHLPQPAWFAGSAVNAQEADPESTLHLYRRALTLRTKTKGASLTWVREDNPDVLHFTRDEWHCITNFGSEPIALPAGPVLVTSSQLDHGLLPPDATAWALADSEPAASRPRLAHDRI
jgi:alpha-glucosidase